MFIPYTNSLFYVQQIESYLSRLGKKNPKLPNPPKNSPKNTSHKLFWIQLLKKLVSYAAFKYHGVCGGFLFASCCVFFLNVSQLKVWPMDISSFKSSGNKTCIPLA